MKQQRSSSLPVVCIFFIQDQAFAVGKQFERDTPSFPSETQRVSVAVAVEGFNMVSFVVVLPRRQCCVPNWSVIRRIKPECIKQQRYLYSAMITRARLRVWVTINYTIQEGNWVLIHYNSLPYLWPDQKFETLFMIWLVNQILFLTSIITSFLVQKNVKLP